MSTVLECREITAGYTRRTVIENVSFQLAAGEMAGLLGPNGAGKTTLFRVLTGLLPVTAGNLALFGRPLAAYTAPERARLIGVVPQELDTPMAFLVEEIVMMGRTAILNRWRSPGERDRQAVENALEAAAVTHLRGRIFSELSGGEKQRTVIAMALAQEPEILLLDEATSHLDLHHRLEILELLERLNRERGMTILMTSHDLNLASRFCRRLLLLESGRLAADGTPAEVIREELLSRIFRCELRIRPDPDSGLPAVFPIRSQKAAAKS